MSELGTCSAIKNGPSPQNLATWIRDFSRMLAGSLKVERCGAPATKQTVLGPMCDHCFDELRRRTYAGQNLLGLLIELKNAQQARAELTDDGRKLLDLVADFTLKRKACKLEFLAEALSWEPERVAATMLELERLGLVAAPRSAAPQ